MFYWCNWQACMDGKLLTRWRRDTACLNQYLTIYLMTSIGWCCSVGMHTQKTDPHLSSWTTTLKTSPLLQRYPTEKWWISVILHCYIVYSWTRDSEAILPNLLQHFRTLKIMWRIFSRYGCTLSLSVEMKCLNKLLCRVVKLDLPSFHYLGGESDGHIYFISHCKYLHLAYILSQYSYLVRLSHSHQLTYAR